MTSGESTACEAREGDALAVALANFKAGRGGLVSGAELRADQVLATLGDVLLSSESDTARISAAKILLERLAPKEDDEARRREAVERDAALTEACGLLAEFTALKLASVCGAGAVDQSGATVATDANGELADMVDHGGPRLG